MPNYSYICEVCSTKVEAGLEHCSRCGCPAETNARELNWFKCQWQKSDKTTPIQITESYRLPLCAWTSIAILALWLWLFFAAPLHGTSGDIGYATIVIICAYPLSIGGAISGWMRLQTSGKQNKLLTGICFVFSLAVACLLTFLIALILKLSLGG
jgi:hypothetical protein